MESTGHCTQLRLPNKNLWQEQTNSNQAIRPGWSQIIVSLQVWKYSIIPSFPNTRWRFTLSSYATRCLTSYDTQAFPATKIHAGGVNSTARTKWVEAITPSKLRKPKPDRKLWQKTQGMHKRQNEEKGKKIMQSNHLDDRSESWEWWWKPQ